jgi:hypothetical protein
MPAILSQESVLGKKGDTSEVEIVPHIIKIEPMKDDSSTMETSLKKPNQVDKNTGPR